MTCFSLAHAPKSISLQRSLQNGRHGAAGDHSTSRLQVGHDAMRLRARRQQERHIVSGLCGPHGDVAAS
jgi:hypothetical protein